MDKRLLKILGSIVALVSLAFLISVLLLKIYGPQYLIPYVIEKVQEETKGRYTININADSIKVHLLSLSLNLGYTEFRRDSAVSQNSGIDFLDKFDVHATFQSFRIDVFKLISFIISDRIVVNRILLDQPSIVIRKNIHYNPEKETILATDSLPSQSINYNADSVLADTLAWKEFHHSRGAVTPSIQINQFQIKNGSFFFYDGRKSKPIQEVHGLDFIVKKFIINDQDDIEVDDAEIYIDSASLLVSKNIARLRVKGVDINPESIHLDHLHFGHIVNPYRINEIKGFRASWLNINVDNIDIKGIHPGELISDSTLSIDHASIGYVKLYLFKDKEELVINPAHKALPPEQIREIPIPVLVDTVVINNGDFIIDMEAPQAIAPGRITLNKFQTKILNLTNIPEALEINPEMNLSANFSVMDSARLNLDVTFEIDSPEDSFQVHCRVDPFNASILNGFVGSQFFVEFPSGDIQNLNFYFRGNNIVNVGTMDFEYDNLKVRKLQNYKKYIEGKPNTGFIAGVGNMFIPHNRSSKNKNYKPGVIYYEKEYNRDFIHVTIMSLLSGIESSLGFKTKNIDKQERKAEQLDNSVIEESAKEALDKAEKARQKENKQD